MNKNTNYNKKNKENQSNTRRKYRIKSKFRFITFVVIMLGLTIGTFGYLCGFGTSVALSKPADQITVEVSDGDTVWEIARAYKKDNTDIREAVYKICKVNDLTDGQIYDGMTLTIPEKL